MEEIEASGKSVDEAVTKALAQLGVGRDQVEVTVLQEGRSGLLGLGVEEALVRVRLLPQALPSKAQQAQLALEVLERLLELLNIPAQVVQRPLPSVGGLYPPDSILLDVKGENLGILIGRRGETLATLQFLVNLIVGRQLKTRPSIVVDIEEYKQRREETLRGLARRMAERVRASGQPVTLEPMPASERRIVHLALRDYPDILTQSLGEGENRKVAISLKPS